MVGHVSSFPTVKYIPVGHVSLYPTAKYIPVGHVSLYPTEKYIPVGHVSLYPTEKYLWVSSIFWFKIGIPNNEILQSVSSVTLNHKHTFPGVQ